MSFLHHPFYTSSSQPASLTPLFRLLDDFESYRTDATSTSPSPRQQLKAFTPKFDVKETADAYELHGELPGIEQKDVEIEFTDASTLTVRGRVERSSTSSDTGLIEDSKNAGAIENGKDHSIKAHKATVEDEEEAAKTQLTHPATDNQQAVKAKPADGKFWVSERSIGEFSRSFSFPGRIDQDSVKASMKNGILAIHVPKSRKRESRRIVIE